MAACVSLTFPVYLALTSTALGEPALGWFSISSSLAISSGGTRTAGLAPPTMKTGNARGIGPWAVALHALPASTIAKIAVAAVGWLIVERPLDLCLPRWRI